MSLGFDKKKIEHVLIQRFKKFGKNFATLHDVLNILLDTADIKPPSETAKLTEIYKTLIKDAQCAVCCKEDRCVLFMPCGHLSVCENCSKLCNNCVVCRDKVLRKIKTYK